MHATQTATSQVATGLYTPWGYQPANNNLPSQSRNPLMVGLTGKRNVGKSTAANILEAHGFNRIHAFDAGKEAAETYFSYVTGCCSRASEMVYGELKDVLCADLPGGVAPRFFLEKFGRFMGVEMGIDWTLAMEIAVARRREPTAPIVVESVVYEADWFKAQGGVIIRIERPGFDGPKVDSDADQALIKADRVISATTVEELQRKIRYMAQELLRAKLNSK